jgi:hypothetical protein
MGDPESPSIPGVGDQRISEEKDKLVLLSFVTAEKAVGEY